MLYPMRAYWILIALVLPAFPGWAAPQVDGTAANAQTSTPDLDKEAVRKASEEADKWAGKTAKPEPPKVVFPTTPPAPVSTTTIASVQSSTPTVVKPTSVAPIAEISSPPPTKPNVTPMATPAAAAPLPVKPTAPAVSVPDAAPAPPKIVRQSGLNQMRGTLQAKNDDPKTFRLLIDGGYNVEFSYNNKTSVSTDEKILTMDDLKSGDQVIARYAGRDLLALEIELLPKSTPH